MKQNSKKALLANTFGTVGYFSCILLWGWIALLYLPPLLENQFVEDFLLPTPAQETPTEPIVSAASPATMIFAAATTIIVVVATIIILVKVPTTVAKTGKIVTTKAADTAVPLIARGHELPPAKKKLLTTNLIKLAKLLLILAPIGASLLSSLVELSLPYDIVIIVSSILALSALICFSMQYIFARLLHVDTAQLV